MKKIFIGLILGVALNLSAAEHEVKMLNFGDGGSMIFEPGFLKVNKGDTIHFKSVDLAHNSESVKGLIPAGASPWKGEINENISVTLNEEGVYVYQCTPHLMMAMVGVIQVDNNNNLDDVKLKASQLKNSFVTNKERLDQYLSEL